MKRQLFSFSVENGSVSGLKSVEKRKVSKIPFE
jgi:hypothetical protein